MTEVLMLAVFCIFVFMVLLAVSCIFAFMMLR